MKLRACGTSASRIAARSERRQYKLETREVREVPFRQLSRGGLVWKAIQATLGVATCALVAQLGLQCFDRRVALFAAACAALYRMLVFYGGNVMIVNVQVPLMLGVLILVQRALRDPRPRRWAAAGLVLGLAALGRTDRPNKGSF